MQHRRRLLPVIVALVLLRGLSAFGQTPPADDETWNNVERTEPSISLSVNGPGQSQIFRGWPILIRLEVWHAQVTNHKALPMILAAKEGPWSGAQTLEVTDGRGQAQRWPLHLATVTEKLLTLTATKGGELIWWLSPDETAQIPVGKYRLLATLDTTQSAAKDGWKGRSVSEPFSIDLQSPPAQLTEEQHLARYFLLASYHLVRKDSQQAVGAINEVLKAQPNHIRGLAFKGDLLAADGKTDEAISLYQQALKEYEKKYPKSKQPPVYLL